MSFAAGGRQHTKINLAAGTAKGVGEPARQLRRKITVVRRHQPGHRRARILAEERGGGDQRLRRANLIGNIVGMAATAWGKGDDDRDDVRILMRQRQRAPSAGRMADNDRAVLPDERLAAHELVRQRDLGGGGARGAGIVGLVAAALVFEIASTRRAMAQAFWNQHGKAARGEELG